MLRSLTAMMAVLVALVLPGMAQAATITVPPGGNLTTAYNNAASGDTIQLQAGKYGQWTMPSGTKTLTIKGVAGTKFLQIKDQNAANVTFDGLDLDAEGTHPTGAVFDLGGIYNITLKNSRVGNVVDEKGAMLGGDETSSAKHNVVIDNVVFHDVRASASTVHNECIMTHTPGVTIRNSTFTNCQTFDVSLGRGDWYGQGQYGNVTIENNVFGHSVGAGLGGSANWHYYGLAWWLTTLDNARVVNNTFENEVSMDRAVASTNGVWANNIGGGWACVSGVTYTGNVGKNCSVTDKATTPQFSRAGQPQPVGWVNPIAGDFHLTSGSVAINAGSSLYAPITDKDGKSRVGAPDAGAYEYAGTVTPPPACNDGNDNDGDSKIDYPADPGCSSTTDTTESPDPTPPPPPAICNDGLDNDGDGKVDFPADLGCSSTTDTTEAPDPTSYHPACEPTCDSQITTLTSDRDAQKARADALKAKLDRIDTIVHE